MTILQKEWTQGNIIAYCIFPMFWRFFSSTLPIVHYNLNVALHEEEVKSVLVQQYYNWLLQNKNYN